MRSSVRESRLRRKRTWVAVELATSAAGGKLPNPFGYLSLVLHAARTNYSRPGRSRLQPARAPDLVADIRVKRYMYNPKTDAWDGELRDDKRLIYTGTEKETHEAHFNVQFMYSRMQAKNLVLGTDQDVRIELFDKPVGRGTAPARRLHLPLV